MVIPSIFDVDIVIQRQDRVKRVERENLERSIDLAQKLAIEANKHRKVPKLTLGSMPMTG